ncbi:sulfotransferase 2B1-like [Gymnodraco acuticeps]|uniref:Sulfotransferase n=1 Tax=Gymnodraco acuticeps TaxID=8218 RepID=A0A6P8VY35_GYMAC|nr:sulfotransferase 2B1-like [Gymnodraco acuticeps]
MKEIVSLIMSGGDPEPVDNIVNWKRVPWLELQQTASLELEQRPSPRLLTTHFQYNMMPPSFFEVKPKVIYVTRNPKDVFTSSFHHHEAASFLVDPGPQTQFLHNFLDGKGPAVTAPPQAPEEPMQLGRMRISPEERRRRLQEGCCFYCGHMGHQQAICPGKGHAHQP